MGCMVEDLDVKIELGHATEGLLQGLQLTLSSSPKLVKLELAWSGEKPPRAKEL